MSFSNADLMPKWLPSDEVTMEGWHPDWVKNLVMVQMNPHTVTKEGTFEAAIPVLDHYRDLGVNAIWMTPIYDRGETGNGYSNLGLHTVDPSLTGKLRYEEGWQEAARFVKEAHKRDIRIYFDVIVWGTVKESALVNEHPDWYYKKPLNVWGGYKWNWYSQELREWFTDQIIRIVEITDADGFRVDLEPFETGHTFFAGIRRRLLAMGHKISIFAECTSEREEAYDFDEQLSNEDPERWNMHTLFTERLNIVDAVKNGYGHGTIYAQDNGKGGTARFYCLCLSCHDNQVPCVCGDRVIMGYSGLFSPFIPLWFAGEEWDNPHAKIGSLYINPMRWDLLKEDEKCRAFCESVRKMLHIRRSYPDIFTCFPENHRDSNICKVPSDDDLQAYARYAGHHGLLIVPNNGDKARTFTLEIPVDEMQLEKVDTVRELLNGNKIKRNGNTLQVTVDAHDLAVILVEE